MRKTLLALLATGSFLGVLAGSEPTLSDRAVDALRSLPFGVADNPSLILRSRHITKVNFAGAGSSSRYGFSQSGGLILEGLWLRLTNKGPESWSRASIVFDSKLDASRYDALVFWIRSNRPDQKLFITFQDRGWTNTRTAQARSLVFPKEGLPENRPVQVVVPFSTLVYNGSTDFSRLYRIGLEFGRETVGNTEGDVGDIYGFAFVKEPASLKNISVISPERPAATVRVREPRVAETRRKEVILPPAPVQESIAPPVAKVKEKPAPVNPIDTQALVIPLSLPKEVPSAPSGALFKELSEVRNIHPAKPAATLKTMRGAWDEALDGVKGDFLYVALSTLILGGAILLVFRRRAAAVQPHFGPLFHRINWPLQTTGLANSLKAEKIFWKKLSDRKISQAWLSPYNASIEREPLDEHYGEAFLRRQIKLAKKNKIHVFPNLCFVRSLFHFESFLENPDAFLTKKIPPHEAHLSDEELRMRHIGFFPVWIPPFWQKKKNLPQKMLVAYGKMPGTMATSDSVQYNLRAPELRKMAIRVLERFAETGIGVRIEGAAALLNASLNLYWGGYFNELGLAKENEFWQEVIAAVKSKHRTFTFIADSSGSASQKLVDLGFDHIENDQLVEVLINQIHLGSVGPFESLLTPDTASLLSHSVYDISPLFRISHTENLPRKQSLLAAMIIGFLPGAIEPNGQIPQELSRFFTLVAHWAPFRRGKFVLLRTTSADVLAFARWEKKIVYIVVVNFSNQRRSVAVGFEPFYRRLDPKKLYLFNDALHGASLLADLKNDLAPSPAVAVLGNDLKEMGLSIPMSELSLRLFSVNLGQPVSHESPREIRELHKT